MCTRFKCLYILWVWIMFTTVLNMKGSWLERDRARERANLLSTSLFGLVRLFIRLIEGGAFRYLVSSYWWCTCLWACLILLWEFRCFYSPLNRKECVGDLGTVHSFAACSRHPNNNNSRQSVGWAFLHLKECIRILHSLYNIYPNISPTHPV